MKRDIILENMTKKVIDSIKKEVLQESSLNRVLYWMQEHDIACITAFRNKFQNATENTLDDRPEELQREDEENGITSSVEKTPYKYKTAEKEQRNRELKAALLKLGYGVTNIRGNYIENFGKIDAIELGEKSLFVVNRNNDKDFFDKIFELSEYYNQDSFLYKPKGDTHGYLIGTNNCDFPGYGNSEDVGVLHIDIENEFLSRVGNASFSFTNKENPKRDDREYNFHTRKKDRTPEEIEEALNLDVYENCSRNAKWAISTMAKRVELGLLENRKRNE